MNPNYAYPSWDPMVKLTQEMRLCNFSQRTIKSYTYNSNLPNLRTNDPSFNSGLRAEIIVSILSLIFIVPIFVGLVDFILSLSSLTFKYLTAVLSSFAAK